MSPWKNAINFRLPPLDSDRFLLRLPVLGPSSISSSDSEPDSDDVSDEKLIPPTAAAAAAGAGPEIPGAVGSTVKSGPIR